MSIGARISCELRRHWPVLVLAVFVGLITTVPPSVAVHRMGAAYQGVSPVVIDDQMYYLARGHETFDGHPTLGSPYLAEYKDTPSGQSWVPDMVLARISELFGGLQSEVTVYGFFFPFLVVLLSYAIMHVLSRDRLLSFALAALADPGINFQTFLRTPHPQLLTVLFAALLAILLSLERKSARWAIVAAVLGGSLFYMYPFYWTYYVVMVALAVPACFLLVRDSGAHKTLGSILLGSLALGIPYFIENYRVSKLWYYHEALQRNGVISTHFPSGFYITIIVASSLAVWLWAWYKRFIPRTPANVFIACAAAAGVAVASQAVITGVNFFFTVHYTTFVEFMCIFVLGASVPAIFYAYMPQRKRYAVRWIAATIVIALSLWHAVPGIIRLSTPTVNDIAVQRYGPVLQWLDANTKTDEVVYADNVLSTYIPAYTRDNVLFSSWAEVNLMPDREVRDRFIRWHYFDGLTRESIIAREADVFGAYYLGVWQHTAQINKLRRLLGMPPLVVDRYPESDIQSLIDQEHLLQKKPFLAAIQGYHLRYLVWDTTLHPEWRVAAVPGLHKLYEANGLVVYAMPSSS